MRTLLLIIISVITSSAAVIPPDRVANWFGYPPGVAGGPITNRTVWTNMTLIDNTGASDVSAALQYALSNCASNQSVALPSGTFLIQTGLYLKAGITLKGAGRTSTWLNFTNGSGVSGLAVYLSSASSFYYPGDAPLQSNDVVNAIAGGNSADLLAGTYNAGFTNGRVCILDQTNDLEWFGYSIDGFTYMSRLSGSRMMRQLVEITNRIVDTVQFTPSLVWNYTNQPQMVYAPAVSRWVGIEDLSVTNSTASYAGGSCIDMRQTVDSWVLNCGAYRGGYANIYLQYTLRNTIKGCWVQDSITYNTANRSYGILMAYLCTQNLVEDNVVWHTRSGIMNAGGGPYNVFSYNFNAGGWNTQSAGGNVGSFSPNHGGNPWFTLWEGNVGFGPWVADLFHGGSSYNVLARNFIRGYQPNPSPTGTNSFQRAVIICASNLYYAVVGNVLGDPTLQNTSYSAWTYQATTNDISNTKPYIFRNGFNGTGESTALFDDRVLSTTLVHGNFDWANTNVVWDPGIADHDVPYSYYLGSRPAWFGTLDWPPITATNLSYVASLHTVSNIIPAMARFYGIGYIGTPGNQIGNGSLGNWRQ